MKVQLLLGSAAATIALANGSEIDKNEDLSRYRLPDSRARGRLSNEGRDLRAVPRTSFGSTRKSHDEEASMSKASKKSSKTAKADEDMPSNENLAPSSKSSKSPESGDNSAKSAKTNGGKSGKSSKEAYYLGPISCPGHCVDVSGVNFVTGELNNVLKPCDNESQDQTWIVHNDDTFVKVESVVYPGMCIGIENRNACAGGFTLSLGDCEDHESMWYFTGGQLMSAYCWVNGYTNIMGVLTTSSSCNPGLFGFEGADNAVVRGDLFMFIGQDMIQAGRPTTESSYAPTYSPTYFPTSSPPN